ncbi:hypothetical protein ACLMJK_004490 [Lecanora helva]
MAGLAFLGPEFMFQLALGQWWAARRSVKEFRRLKYTGWTTKHAFLADMGGFALQTALESTGEDWAYFPVDAKQTLYLVEHGYVPYNDVRVDKKVIEDKYKTDGLVRVVIVCQILWYCVECAARLYQHLDITLLEVATVGFIFCSAGTYGFWYEKPMDVGRAIVLRPNATIDQILRDAGGRARQPYRQTPMDFVGREEWSWTLYRTHWKNLVRPLGINWDRKIRPMDKIPDDNFPVVTGWPTWVLAAFQVGYGAVHLTGWNLSFPTHTEMVLWHTATLAIMVCIVGTWAVEVYSWRLPMSPGRNEKDTIANSTNRKGSATLPRWRTMHRMTSFLRNTTRSHDPVMDVPLRALLPVTIFATTYSFFCFFIIVEGFVNLRAVPPSSYQSVNWTAFFPHFEKRSSAKIYCRT